MARGLLSSRVAALAAAAGCLATAAAVTQQQSCEVEGGHCPSVVDEHEEGDQASLLVRKATTKAHDHDRAAEARRTAGGANGTASCNEVKFQGLCYRTCTDMGEMEPRRSPSNCGGVEDYNLLQRCNSDGTSSAGAGSAPGIMGRPMGGCFGDESTSLHSKAAPNLCTTACKYGAHKTGVKGSSAKFCCADGESTPQVHADSKDLTCACPLGKKPPMKWLPEPMGVLKTTVKKPCNTVCSKANSWLMSDNIAYCCPGNKKPAVSKVPGIGDYTVQCSCP